MSIFIPILQIKKLRLRKIKGFGEAQNSKVVKEIDSVVKGTVLKIVEQ